MKRIRGAQRDIRGDGLTDDSAALAIRGLHKETNHGDCGEYMNYPGMPPMPGRETDCPLSESVEESSSGGLGRASGEWRTRDM